jgi:hypothetical protein
MMSPMPRKKKETEGKLVKPKIRQLLDKHGWFWWNVHSSIYGDSTGVSDIHAVGPGVFMVIEAKHTKTSGAPTEMQKGFLRSIATCQHFAFVVNELTLEVFERFLDAFAKSVKAEEAGYEVAPEDGSTMLDCMKILTAAYN